MPEGICLCLGTSFLEWGRSYLLDFSSPFSFCRLCLSKSPVILEVIGMCSTVAANSLAVVVEKFFRSEILTTENITDRREVTDNN